MYLSLGFSFSLQHSLRTFGFTVHLVWLKDEATEWRNYNTVDKVCPAQRLLDINIQLAYVVIQEDVNRTLQIRLILYVGIVYCKHEDLQCIQFTLANSGRNSFPYSRQPDTI